jgi:type II secretory ATPase GspE/PulE/Tfp pilus assembly ATPase PilB-like protein
VQHAKDASLVLYQVMAEEKDITFNPTIAQDAVLDRMLGGKRLRVRVGTIPAAPDGFDVILRLMPYDENEKDVQISELGYIDDQLLDIEMGMSKPIGVIVFAGVTGSGKTTSLVAMIRQIISEANGSIKVITIENPPEQFIRGATQHAVPSVAREKGASAFAAAVRAALRADPDVLMVGEVRDVDTAKTLISAVQSGHKVFTTIHAPSGIGIVGRMRSMGIPNDVLGSSDFFSGLIYQTLIKTICPHCSIPLSDYGDGHADDTKFQKLLRRLALTVNDLGSQNIRFINPKGCGHAECHNGITGRTVVAEVIIPDHKMNSYFAKGQDMEAWHHFRKNGGKSSLMVGIEKMKQGLLDPYDVERSLGLLNSEIIMADGTFNYDDERISQGTWESKPSQPVTHSEKLDFVQDDMEMDMLMEEPNTELASLSSFSSEIFNEKIQTAEVISIGSRSSASPRQVENEEESIDSSDD